MSTSRRDFLANAGTLLLAGLALPVIESCLPTSAPLITPPASTPVGPDGTVEVDVLDLSPAKPFKIAPGVIGPDGMGVVVTLDNGTYRAFSQRCSHAGCPVDNQATPDKTIHCSCHNSYFGLDGVPISGPAVPIKLTEYTTTLDASSHLLKVKIA
jgi:Rieske Fe-S protein